MNHTVLFFACIISLATLCIGCQQAHSTSIQSEQNTLQPDTLPSPDTTAQLPSWWSGIDLNYIMGRFDPATHPDFVKIDKAYADKEGMYLRRETYDAFIKMHDAALKDSIRLQIRSATRSFYAQKSIWEGKWTGTRLIENGENLSETTPDPKERALKILRFSSMPGSSRHHWGTDIDLNNFENSWFAEGEGLRMYKWLVAHAAGFGFCQPYTEGRPHGYWEERWHWSYTPVSAPLTAFARDSLNNEMINGFLGSETADDIDIVRKYVLGINETCNHTE